MPLVLFWWGLKLLYPFVGKAILLAASRSVGTAAFLGFAYFAAPYCA